MREIKFRAWDATNKKMHSSVGEGRVHSGGRLCLQVVKSYSDTCSIEDELCEPKDFALMQYTGLKDKKGKDIYEGDIIETEVNGNRYLKQVKYGEPLEYGWNLAEPNPEIIGNIYENPDLLK